MIMDMVLRLCGSPFSLIIINHEIKLIVQLMNRYKYCQMLVR